MSSGFLDFHTHILPDMDDGVAYPAESIQLLLAEKRSGVSDVCLTPHYYAEEESVSSFLNRRQRSFSLLRETMKKSWRSFPKLHLGAEVHYYEGISREPLLSLLCCGASRCVLIEPPMRKWSESMFLELSDIRSKQHLQPVIAHLDRYISIFDDPSLCSQMRDHGFWIQFNASSFLQGQHRQLAFELFQSGEIYFVGSDAHNPHSRPVNYGELVSVLNKNKLMDRLFSISNSGIALLKGYNSD